MPVPSANALVVAPVSLIALPNNVCGDPEKGSCAINFVVLNS